MKRIIKKLRKLNNSGSSIVMVIVALAFLAVIVGSLLSAAGYAYKLKFQDLNARDNFYYVEQAMNEVYAGVGADTIDSIREAYIYTVENMTRFDVDKGVYVTVSDDDCQKMFAEKFIELFSSDSGKYSNVDEAKKNIESFITNDTVNLDPTKLLVTKHTVDGKIDSITIKNITLTRTQEYKKSVANGTFKQTITTDIVIGKPNFKVLFNAASSDYSNLFNYAVVADMGVEVNQPVTPLTISGNVYAANDFYNKKYNAPMYDAANSKDQATKLAGDGAAYTKYSHVPVTSKIKNDTKNEYFNEFDLTFRNNSGAKYYDGENTNSMYSGLYIEHSDVSIIGDRLIVPGTIAVMDRGSLSVHGKQGKLTSESEVWADNLVLGGFSSKTYKADDKLKKNPVYNGASAIIKADLYVRDDTELNAAGSNLVLNGSYYGYGDSTTKDTRVYTTVVDEDNFKVDEKDAQGNVVQKNRGHYNSSAIIVNGEKSNLDFSNTDSIFLAGRSYIELSKKVTKNSDALFSEETADGKKIDILDNEGKVVQEESGVTQSYTYLPKEKVTKADGTEDTIFIRDYKLGESISSAANQKAYVPVTYKAMPEKAKVADSELGEYYEASLPESLDGVGMFEKYFPKDVFKNRIPCIMQSVSNKKYFYYHFAKVYKEIKLQADTAKISDATRALVAEGTSPETFAVSFITDYAAELNNADSAIKDYLVDIGHYEDFDLGTITLPENSSSIVYSSGAITTKENTTFSISTKKNNADLSSLFSASAYAGTGSTATDMSENIGKEYEYVKWNLDHYKTNLAEQDYVDKLVANGDFGDASITPINKYLDFTKINTGTNYNPNTANLENITGDIQLWVSNSNVLITDADGDGSVNGVIITKGDVSFANDVQHFTGLIVAGGKVYITNSLQTLQCSPQTCSSLLRNCQLSDSNEAKYILELFMQESSTPAAGGNPDETPRTIDTIDYSDVVSFENWMKNVE